MSSSFEQDILFLSDTGGTRTPNLLGRNQRHYPLCYGINPCKRHFPIASANIDLLFLNAIALPKLSENFSRIISRRSRA